MAGAGAGDMLGRTHHGSHACASPQGTSRCGSHHQHNPASGGAPTSHSGAGEELIPFAQLSEAQRGG